MYCQLAADDRLLFSCVEVRGMLWLNSLTIQSYIMSGFPSFTFDRATNKKVQLSYHLEKPCCGMASSLNLVPFLFLCSLWSICNAAMNTLKPGDTLDSSRSLVSENGNFTMNFRIYDDPLSLSYLVIKRNASHNYAWVANPYKPVLYPFGVLTLDRNNILQITQKDGDPVVLYNASETTSSSVEASLLDTGNFVLQEVSSDGLTKMVLWQSFDYPGDVLLPGMKLGVNRSNGHNWSLTSWFTEKSAIPGSFTLDWDPEDHELKIRRKGLVYWRSGVFRDGNFVNIKQKRYNFSIVSNNNEDSFIYTPLDQGATSEWLLTTVGRLYDFDDSFDIAKADYCYGYNTNGGCQVWEQPTKCRRLSDVFEQENGYFEPLDSASGSNTTSKSDTNTSVTISDCKAACWEDCDCLGFTFLFDNQTGCRYWTGNLKFIADSTGYTSSLVYFLTTTKSARSHSHLARKWKWIAPAISVMVLCFLGYLLRRTRITVAPGDDTDGSTHGSVVPDLRVFSYESIMTATENFCIENKLGEGGFGPVYKGSMPTGQEIAVKTLSRRSVQGEVEFKNELILIYELQHTNLVQLFGYCIHGEERMLIYEYMANKSLDCILFDSNRCMLLDWRKRFNIIEGIAQGLLYLHKYSRSKVIHRDLKASNILLDDNMHPKISDFGTARMFMQHEVEAITRRVVGTYGYMSPEYAMQGIFSEKSDVFSFGVLMLEIISGRKNNSFHPAHRALNLVGYAWQLWQEGAGLELMDATLNDSCVENQFLRCIHVGLLCVEEDLELRPTMSDAISMLTNESLLLPVPIRPVSFPARAAEVDTRGNNFEISENGLSCSLIIGR